MLWGLKKAYRTSSELYMAFCPPCVPACSSRYGSTLSQEEVKAALDLLDTNKDGRIQFGEFVDWWVEKSGVETKATAA